MEGSDNMRVIPLDSYYIYPTPLACPGQLIKHPPTAKYECWSCCMFLTGIIDLLKIIPSKAGLFQSKCSKLPT